MTDFELPRVTIYTDGGASPNPGPGGWGVVLLFDPFNTGDAPRQTELSGGALDTTNNRMELTAAIEALRTLQQPHHIALYTNSQYVKKGINEWMAGWKKTNFKNGKIQNAELWVTLDQQVSRHKISWQWVKGHAGNRYNERVDQLATAARESLTGVVAGESPQPTLANYAYLMVSCIGSPGAGAWAVLLDYAGAQHILAGNHPRTNPARLDLLAGIAALEAVPEAAELQILTGSSYLRDGITQWVSGWKKNQWIKKTGGEVLYRDLWEKLDQLAQRRTVKWTLIKADARPPEMELLDQPLRQQIALAKRG